ncbi:MAG TPA: kynureninase [Nocardioidaceae bacterium]|nr:kynureninase [Nocardioidaceae bacterium]
MPEATSRSHAERLDDIDPLGDLRDRFTIGSDLVAYFDGNSLGRLPKATIERLSQVLDREWGDRLIQAWTDGWMNLPTAVGDRLAADVLGGAPGQTVVADSTSVNLFKVLHAACGLRPDRSEIVIDDANFPTDRYLVESVAEQRGLTVRWLAIEPPEGVTAERLAPAIGPATAAVVVCHVDYRSGALADLAGLTRLIHSAGAIAVWDLSHSAGAVPIGLDAADADFAVGCTYKYLNAGPGAPAFLYVASRHLSEVRQPIAGWFGAEDIFAMGPAYEPAKGIRRMLSGTPNVLGLVAVDEGVRLIAEAGIDRIRTKSVALTDLVTDLADAWLTPHGAELASPREADRRGSHVTVRHPKAATITDRLLARGVIPDFRNPDLIRLGLSPLTTSYAEAWDGLDALRGIIAR